MVCQICHENTDCVCPDCEKYPKDIHTTPPNLFIYSYPVSEILHDPRPPRILIEERLSQLEQDVKIIKERLGI